MTLCHSGLITRNERTRSSVLLTPFLSTKRCEQNTAYILQRLRLKEKESWKSRKRKCAISIDGRAWIEISIGKAIKLLISCARSLVPVTRRRLSHRPVTGTRGIALTLAENVCTIVNAWLRGRTGSGTVAPSSNWASGPCVRTFIQ